MIQLLTLLTAIAVQTDADDPTPRQTVIVIVGAAGDDSYAQQFAQWSQRWEDVCARAGATHVSIGIDAEQGADDLKRLEAALAAEPRQYLEPLWLVLIGHGTFDGRQAKFNLRGPDLTAEQLGQWLAPLERTVVVINCASASSPFLNQLSGKNRVVITSTKSGYQYNFAHFGDYLSQVIGDPAADLDKDGQTSLLEAFLTASARVQEFYRQDARLATEQALLDDNGDALGTPADWFRGVRAVKKAKDDAQVDGVRANQLQLVRSEREQHMTPESRQRRDALEARVAQLRERKDSLEADAYYGQLLPLMLELAELYQAADPAGEKAEPPL